ncbi:jhy protein homolog [Phaethornis superciliosus]
MVSKELPGLLTKEKGSAAGCNFKGDPSAFSLQTQESRPPRAKKDFVEKNKQTLGLRTEKTNSYLQLHSKKQEALQKQVADPKTVDEEPVQSVLGCQTVDLKPEEMWNLRAQQLKPCSSKPYINLNVKLGGLGPDYETIKETKEKLKQQKEYAKQVKEYNMKNTAVQRLPAKPLAVPSASRQKALEYAKTIPKPKVAPARKPKEEVKEENIVPQTLNNSRLPPIASLETLQDRHKKEKQVAAALRTLHIF